MLATYACFIDLRKAFDRVPPEALFRKLESLDIEGGCLELYCGLYRRSWTQLPLQIFEILAPLMWYCRTVAGLSGSLHAQNKITSRQWQLQGKDIPVVEEYRHLGIDLNISLTAEGFML
ncbi:hypothetical protein GAYE_SCF08G2979 [Galdieria yellowstonensis]|uniref:Reverse transcriptase domain-containing protein n=1 Tax=Galdieria yellowstonensis TaxID=3028027 RepID=A0AAV9ICJ5_9RHOD|nr:hypothetical protein GAYE_SCF08G2979 [Galdieria yellowstonensis]